MLKIAKLFSVFLYSNVSVEYSQSYQTDTFCIIDSNLFYEHLPWPGQLFSFFSVLIAPFTHLIEDGDKRLACLRKTVFYLGRDLRVFFTIDQSVRF